MKQTLIACLAFLATLGACLSAHAADGQVRVVPDSQLQQWWHLAQSEDPPLPSFSPDHLPEGCVAIAFMIHSDGTVSNERVWRSVWSDFQSKNQYNNYYLRVVHQRRFTPAATNEAHDPVYTYQVFTWTSSLVPFGTPKPNHSDQLRVRQHEDAVKAKCEMTDFPQQVQAMINTAQAGKKP